MEENENSNESQQRQQPPPNQSLPSSSGCCRNLQDTTTPQPGNNNNHDDDDDHLNNNNNCSQGGADSLVIEVVEEDDEEVCEGSPSKSNKNKNNTTTQSQTAATATQEIMTQNPEWSQLGGDDDDDDLTNTNNKKNNNHLSPFGPGRLSPVQINEREQPWGRLLPSAAANPNHPPTTTTATQQQQQQRLFWNLKSANNDNHSCSSSGENGSQSTTVRQQQRLPLFYPYTPLKPVELLPRSPERKRNSQSKAVMECHTTTAVPGTNRKGGGEGAELSAIAAMETESTPAAEEEEEEGISLLGLSDVRVSDIFNLHVLGRSHKVDVVASEPLCWSNHHTGGDPKGSDEVQKIKAMHEWAYGMISNRHCRIYCRLDDIVAASQKRPPPPLFSLSSPTPQQHQPLLLPPPQVYIEDCSGNGTLINRTVLLRKGERRMLHSGDEICLANPEVLRRKIRSQTMLQQILQQHSFVFVNYLLPQRWKMTTTTSSLLASAPSPPPPARLYPSEFQSTTTTNTTSQGAVVAPTGRYTPAVNVRAMKHPSHNHRQQQQHSNHDRNQRNRHFPWASKQPPSQHGLLQNRNNHDRYQQQQQPSRHNRQPPLEKRRFEEDYDLRDMLGTGTVGQVFRAIHRKTGKDRAVKRIPWTETLSNRGRPRGRVGGNPATAAAAEKEHPWQAEAAILQQLHHPYIVNLIDVYTNAHALYIVMELMPGGDLFDRIVARERYTETASRRVLRRLLSAVHYLHTECNIVHRDLKPENILLQSRSNDIHVKITDFGLAKSCCESSLGGGGGCKTFCGTPQYFAPEVLQRQLTVTGQGSYGKPADMWSIGVILYVLLSGTTPFQQPPPLVNGGGAGAVEPNSLFYHQQQYRQSFPSSPVDFPDEFWHSVSDGAKDLVRKLLVPDPRRRYTVRQACDHAWILMPDGDTHSHPLQDPQLATIVHHHHHGTTTAPPPPVPTKTTTMSTATATNRRSSVSAAASPNRNAQLNETNEAVRSGSGGSGPVIVEQHPTNAKLDDGVQKTNNAKVDLHHNKVENVGPQCNHRGIVETDKACENSKTNDSKPNNHHCAVETPDGGGILRLKPPSHDDDEGNKILDSSNTAGTSSIKKRKDIHHTIVDPVSEERNSAKDDKSKRNCFSPREDQERRQYPALLTSPIGEESNSSRRVSDVSSSSDRQDSSPGTQKAPLTPTNVNDRPQAFLHRMMEQAKSETTKSKNTTTTTTAKPFSECMESITSGSPDTLPSQSAVDEKENAQPPPQKQQRKPIPMGETRSKRKRAKEPTTDALPAKSSTTKATKRKRGSNTANTTTNNNSNGKKTSGGGGHKQTTLSSWFLADGR